MDAREKLVELSDIQVLQREIECVKRKSATNCADCLNCDLLMTDDRILSAYANAIAALRNANGVTVQEWIQVKDRKPTEADGTVLVCLADVFPYNEKEPYIDAKHDRRITEANYSQFSKQWYKDGAVFTDGVVTHWMEKPQPPKGE